MKQVETNPNLSVNKDKVANLSENELDNILGGEAADKTASSTKNDITCCWCTSTVTQPDEDAIG